MSRNWGARVGFGAPSVVLENEVLRVTVLLDGGHVVEFNHKPRDLDHVWLAPDAFPPPGPDFLDSYPGGWQEVLPNGGAPSRHRGAVLGQHAEVANLRWDAEVVEDDPTGVAVRLSVVTRRFPLRLTKVLRLRAGEARLSVEEDLTNAAPVPVEVMWGQHLAYGAPFLRPGARIVLPDGVRVTPHAGAINPPHRAMRAGGPYDWPLVPAPDGGTTDLSVVPAPGSPSDIAYLSGFGDNGWYELRSGDDGAGVQVAWDATVLPYLWLWHELGATADWPWWGRAYVVGLEPFAGYPTDGLAAAVANGSALTLEPHGARHLAWSIGVVTDE